MSEKVRAAKELKSIRELPVSEEEAKFLEANFQDVESVVLLMRQSSPEEFQSGTERAELYRKIYDFLDESGFIRHDLETTFGYNALVNEACYMMDGLIVCAAQFQSNEEYEEFVSMTESQRLAFRYILRRAAGLNGFKITILDRMYGLDGNKSLTQEELSHRYASVNVPECIESVMKDLRAKPIIRLLRANCCFHDPFEKEIEEIV